MKTNAHVSWHLCWILKSEPNQNDSTTRTTIKCVCVYYPNFMLKSTQTLADTALLCLCCNANPIDIFNNNFVKVVYFNTNRRFCFLDYDALIEILQSKKRRCNVQASIHTRSHLFAHINTHRDRQSETKSEYNSVPID